MYIYDIPYRIFRQIVNSLDTDKGWELLASEIGYTFDQIRQLEMVLMQPQGSPTRNLLWDWGCQNATVWDLYDKLKKMKRFREMNFLEKLGKTRQSESLWSSKEVNGEADNTNHSNRVDMMEDFKKSTMLSPVDNPGKFLNYNLNQATVMNVTGKLTDSNNRKINLSLHGSTPSKNSLSDKPNKDLRKTPMESTLPITKRQPKVSISDTHNCVQITSPFSENADSITSTLPIRSLEGCPVFTYKELSCATDGFNDDHKIGEGAFGNVYMGTLRNSECAIKKLVKKAGDGSGSEHITQQRAELVALLKFRHEHIVTLYGYALDGDEICLIYQYMVGGSLEDRLQCKSGTRALNWAQRVNIATGAACGLQYLHTADSRPLIHSDIKSANILLDKHFEAKIGDFGLARYATSGSHTGILTHVSKKNMAGKIYGTKAYLPPEFFRSNGQVSIKGDTYGFGVIILEICTGEKAFDENREPKKFLHEYMQDNLELRKPSDWPLLRDTKAGPVSEKLIIQLMELAQKCISSKKKDRPDMTEVLKELKQLEDDWFNNKLAAEPTTNMLPVDSFEQAQHYESHLSHGSKSPHPLAIPNICENSLKQQQNFLDAPSKQVDPTSPVGQILKTTPAAELPEAARLQLLYDHQDLSGGTTDTELVVDKMKKLQICKELLSSDDKLAKIQKFDETFNSYREPAKLPVITMGPGSCSSADNTVIPGLVSQQQESLEENFALDSFDTEHTSDQPPAGVSTCNSILKKKKMDDFFKDYSQKALGVNSVEEENRRIRLLAECQYLKTDDGVVNLSDNE